MIRKTLVALGLLGWAFLQSSLATAGEVKSLAELSAQVRAAELGEFGSTTAPSTAPFRLDKWQRVLARIERDLVDLAACLETRAACQTSLYRDWRTMMLAATGQPARRQLDAVNAFFNRWAHRPDGLGGSPADSWASPATFFRQSGDCEDYAIAKYASLLLLGIEPSRMRIVAVLNKVSGIGHAVLSVESEGQYRILDSLEAQVLSDHEAPHYRPIFAVSAEKGWIYYDHAPERDGANRAFSELGLLVADLSLSLGPRP